MRVYMFTAIAQNISFSNCHHHSQTIQVTEKEARTLSWSDMRRKQRYWCKACGEPFAAEGGKFDVTDDEGVLNRIQTLHDRPECTCTFQWDNFYCRAHGLVSAEGRICGNEPAP